MAEKIFVDGLIVKRNQKAPEFVICSLSFKAGDFVKFIGDHAVKGWLNVDVKLSKAGDKYYAEVNTWNKDNANPKVEEEEENQAKLNNLPKKGEEIDTIEYPTEDINPEDIPF